MQQGEYRERAKEHDDALGSKAPGPARTCLPWGDEELEVAALVMRLLDEGYQAQLTGSMKADKLRNTA